MCSGPRLSLCVPCFCSGNHTRATARQVMGLPDAFAAAHAHRWRLFCTRITRHPHRPAPHACTADECPRSPCDGAATPPPRRLPSCQPPITFNRVASPELCRAPRMCAPRTSLRANPAVAAAFARIRHSPGLLVGTPRNMQKRFQKDLYDVQQHLCDGLHGNGRLSASGARA